MTDGLQFVGRFPVRSELETISPRSGLSLGELEFAEHGSIALRVPLAWDSPIRDNILDDSWMLLVHGTVLIRAKNGGFFTVPLERDSHGWVVYVGSDAQELRVELDATRKCWVVRSLPE